MSNPVAFGDLVLCKKPVAWYSSYFTSAESSSTASMEVDVETKGEETTAVPWKPKKAEWLIMLSLAFISFMVALDATILVTVLPEISRSLGGSSVEAFWAGTSYLLTSAIFQPVIASISRQFGRQQLLITSLLFFTVGTVLCAVANDYTKLLTGRCIQGVGGGGIITMAQVIYCDVVPLRQRPQYFSIVLGAWSIGTILGPVIGGVITEHTSWRWCFHVNYPFCGIGLIVAICFIRLNAVTELSFAQKLKQTNWMGALIFVGSMTSLLVGLSWGGIQHPWGSAATLAPIIMGLFGIGVFVGWQIYAGPNSLLPMSLFDNWSAAAAFYSSLAQGLVLFAIMYYVPFYRMSVSGKSATQAGIDLLPASAFLVPGSIIVSILTTRLGRFRWAIWSGWAVTILACGLMMLYNLHTRLAVYSVIMAIFGLGSGMVLTSTNVGIQAISKEEDAGMAGCMYAFFRSVGMPLGVTLSGTIFQNAMSGKLSSLGLTTDIAHDSERWLYILRDMANGPEKFAIRESYMEGFHAVFIMTLSVAASALVVSLFIRKFSMDKILQAQFTAR